jgi:hypothetical protein
MSDFDPNRVNDPYNRDPVKRDVRYGAATGSSWAWIVGAIAVVVVVLVALGIGRNDQQTAGTGIGTTPPIASPANPPSTTGMGAPRPAPAEPATPAAPANPPASTNQ